MTARQLAAIRERIRIQAPFAVIAEAVGGWEWCVRDGRSRAVLAVGSTDTRGVADVQAATAIARTQRRKPK